MFEDERHSTKGLGNVTASAMDGYLGDERRRRAPEPGEGIVRMRGLAPQKPRALIVDDDRMVGTVMRRLLDAVGFDATLSDSGAHALDLIRRGERFAFVVSDVQMPGIDGLAFFETARLLWPSLRDKLVFVSGAGQPPRIGLGEVRCFAKPVGRDFYEHMLRVLAQAR